MEHIITHPNTYCEIHWDGIYTSCKDDITSWTKDIINHFHMIDYLSRNIIDDQKWKYDQ